eukprot:TRINITY_DN33439_c0_g1_i1.p1 TRINITY_DN33439_c0_g1~~TRINITY_DN33439_c0_g1_i1.p1  ORF type:complete len:397 (+),score=50.02 TRINITY_DN33439_c0_g1_i1:27-1193(+)
MKGPKQRLLVPGTPARTPNRFKERDYFKAPPKPTAGVTSSGKKVTYTTPTGRNSYTTPQRTPVQSTPLVHQTPVYGTPAQATPVQATPRGQAPPTGFLGFTAASDEDPLKKLKDIERSKYFGGDIEHTHLVKGLDYALLSKVKHEIAQKEAEEEKVQEQRQQVEETKRAQAIRAGAKFSTTLGRNIFSLLFTEKANQTDTFLPGRTTYVFDFSEEAADVPTTQLRSKYEVKGSYQDRFYAGLTGTHPVIEKKIRKAITARNQGIKDRARERDRERKKEKERQEQKRRDEARPKYDLKERDRDRDDRYDRDRDYDRKRDRDRRDKDRDRDRDRRHREKDRDRHDRKDDRREREAKRAKHDSRVSVDAMSTDDDIFPDVPEYNTEQAAKA